MENLYKEGTIITAKAAPADKLIIIRYYKRIYYCELINDPGHKLLSYFEGELVDPLNQYLL